jgi:hypothetical protein
MDHDLTPEQQVEAQRLTELLHGVFTEELQHMVRLLVRQEDQQLLGHTEFALRDLAHRLAARSLQTAVNERKKGGTAAPA